MNKNLDEIKRLVNAIKLHRYLYYNKQPRITDQAYDGLIERLRQLDPTNEELLKTGADPDEKNGWPKAEHTMRLSSLNNSMSIEEFRGWAAPHGPGKIYVGEDKFDGSSLELIYDIGEYVQAITRGNGRRGDDISINAKAMKYVPATITDKSKLSIRGEIMLFKKDFQDINKELIAAGEEPFKNPRNAANGISKNFDGKYLDKLRFVAYDVISSDRTFSWETEKMDFLNDLGFVVATYKLLTAEAVIQLREQYMSSLREQLPYNIDGLVVKLNSITKQKELGLHPNGDPKGQSAFKFDARGVATTLLDIKPTVGRTGVITPNAVIDPVDIDGSKVKAASVCNYDEVKRLGLGIGDTILVIKSGEIIPKIVQVIKSAGKPIEIPTCCPVCHGPVVKEEDSAYLYCDNDECEGQEFRRLRHWVDVLKKRCGLDGIGTSTVEQLYEKDLIKDPADFYQLTVNDIADLDRSGEKSATKIVNSFTKTKEMDVVSFLAALGIPSLGPDLAEAITEEYDLYALLEEVSESDLLKISGIGDSRAHDVMQGLSQRRPLIDKLLKLGIKIKKVEDVKVESTKLSGKSFQVTGAFTKTNPKTGKSYKREQWYEFVIANGGTISSVNKNLDFLVTIKNSGNKITKANELGIKMLSEDEFWKMVE